MTKQWRLFEVSVGLGVFDMESTKIIIIYYCIRIWAHTKTSHYLLLMVSHFFIAKHNSIRTAESVIHLRDVVWAMARKHGTSNML